MQAVIKVNLRADISNWAWRGSNLEEGHVVGSGDRIEAVFDENLVNGDG